MPNNLIRVRRYVTQSAFVFFKQLRYQDTFPRYQALSTATFPVIESTPKLSKTKSKRRRSDYVDNYTGSLLLPCSMEELREIRDDKQKLLEVSKNNILEHAARRSDLFFYALLAFHGKGVSVVRGKTTLQHGIGRGDEGESITQACHSSLFGAFNQDLFGNLGIIDSLNATVELPAFVNKLDDELEQMCQCREKGLAIIQRVSDGKLDPLQGMQLYFIMMEAAFSKLEKAEKLTRKSKPFLTREIDGFPDAIKLPVIDLEKQGTFRNKWNRTTRRITDDYIQMILRVNEGESIACIRDQAFQRRCYREKMSLLQDEIFQARSAGAGIA